MLKNFSALKLNWDHNFFKSIINPKIPNSNKKISVKGIDQYGDDMRTVAENLIQQDMDSIIDPKYQSFISNNQEEKIPQYPVQITQNKKMVSIWYESKEVMQQTLRRHHLMT